ncbi:hypothetical protein TIFTF001_015998 [Ficus carica]|uniref:Anthocyanidin 3-O-glucosyltransferase n=1 Tax=Ficus carica TaxID=3494 RepID=A0AA88D5P3_FICCA|nr:hypothetical protein TIFTF001_015998 [Ficus carica]
MADQLHLVMFPFFAFGHVSSFIQLSNKLSSRRIRFSFFTIPSFIPRVKTLLVHSINTEINPLQLPPSLGLSANLAETMDLPLSEAIKLITAIDLTQPQLGIKAIMFSVFSTIANAFVIAPNRLYGKEGIPIVDHLIKPPQSQGIAIWNSMFQCSL